MLGLEVSTGLQGAGLRVPSVGFWELAGCFAAMMWLFHHVDGHLLAIKRDPTIELNSILYWALWCYHWFGLAPFALPFWYGYKTVWWHALALIAATVLLRLILAGVERSSGWLRSAWAISLLSLLLIPILVLASLLIMEQATGTTNLYEHCKVCGL